MPTVPMFIQHPQPTDASHGVFAPGGYEWWHFDAEDEKGYARIGIDLCAGYPFHPKYLENLAHYLRAPTRRRPPLPADYSCVVLTVREPDRSGRLGIFDCSTRTSVRASTAGLNVVIGETYARRERDRIVVRVGGKGGLGADAETARGPTMQMIVELSFRPLISFRPTEYAMPLPGRRGEHRWVLAEPLCTVEGVFRTDQHQQPVSIKGLGYCDYRYGTSGGDIRRTDFRGRLLLPDRFCAFHVGRDADGRVWGCLTEHNGETITEPVTLDASLGPEVPLAVSFGDVLRLDEPEYYNRTEDIEYLVYRARYRGADGSALCEIVNPGMENRKGLSCP